MRVGITGAAHLLRCTTSAVNNWSKRGGFPKPLLTGTWREWAPEDLEAWATANWENKPALRNWAVEKGYAKPIPEVPKSGIPAAEWDTVDLMRKIDVSRHLGLRQPSGGRIFDRLDFPTATARNPDRWDPVAVRDWAVENAHIKSLSGWVDAKSNVPQFEGYVIHDISQMLGLSVRATYGLMERDFDFPLEIAPGGWDRKEVDSWKTSHFDLPDYPYRRG